MRCVVCFVAGYAKVRAINRCGGTPTIIHEIVARREQRVEGDKLDRMRCLIGGEVRLGTALELQALTSSMADHKNNADIKRLLRHQATFDQLLRTNSFTIEK